MALVVGGLTIALYTALLGSMYLQGYWIADLITLLLAEAALIWCYACMIGYGKLTTQSIARLMRKQKKKKFWRQKTKKPCWS